MWRATLSDPHGTHRVCAEAIFRVLKDIEAERGSRPEALLYRGAWQEYDLHEIELVVPLSPKDLQLKRKAIFHAREPEKTRPSSPAATPANFGSGPEDRNKGTAEKYNQIGLPEYFAMEAFVRWNGVPI